MNDFHADFESGTPTAEAIQVQWKQETVVSAESLERIFSKYGKIYQITLGAASTAHLLVGPETCVRILEDTRSAWRHIYSVSLEKEPGAPVQQPKKRSLFSSLMADASFEDYERLTFERLIPPRRS